MPTLRGKKEKDQQNSGQQGSMPSSHSSGPVDPTDPRWGSERDWVTNTPEDRGHTTDTLGNDSGPTGYVPGSGQLDYLGDLAKETMDMQGALGDVKDINSQQAMGAQQNLGMNMAGRGMAGSAAAGGMAGALGNKYSRDLASEWEATRRNKLREMNELGSRLYQDKWNMMDREQQMKMAEWMFEHQKEMAAYLEAIKQNRPGALESLSNELGGMFGWGPLDAISGLPFGLFDKIF